MTLKTFQEFYNEILGKYPYQVPISGFSSRMANPEQCVTLIKAYAHECFSNSITQASTFGHGRYVWTTALNQNSTLKSKLKKMTVSEVAESGGYRIGDIISCGSPTSPNYGHVVICLTNHSNYKKLAILEQWNHNANGGRPRKGTLYTRGQWRKVYGVLRPTIDLGEFKGKVVGGSDNIVEEEEDIKIKYDKWTGQGIIKKDYTNLLWFKDTKLLKKWGFNDGQYYGMKNEVFKIIGKLKFNNKHYYYGTCIGLCNARIWCLVPTDKILNKTGKKATGVGYIKIGTTYSNDSSSDSGRLKGSNNKEKIWNTLINVFGFTAIAAAGIMGNWQIESGNNPKTIEGHYYSDFPGADQVLLNNNSMNNWAKKLFDHYQKDGIKISKNAYKGTDGNYYVGLGLAQWTGPRGYKLIRFGGDDWGTLEKQLAFFRKEISKDFIRNLNSKKTPESAAEYFARHYERITRALDKRKQNARKIYNEYK